MNAFTYIKNVGKSAKYIAIDIAKDYSPGLTSLAEQANELGPELYKSIKDFKTDPSSKSNELGFVNDTKDVIKEFGTNLIADAKSGNWYNKQRLDKAEEDSFNDMMKDMGIENFDTNPSFDDDFGDFEFENDESSGPNPEQAQLTIDQQSTAATIKALDITGNKVAGAVGLATANSADYIVRSSKASSKAIYSLTNRGFEKTTAGLAAINSNITNLVNFTQPLTVHMQNSQKFFTTNTDNQVKMIDLLNKIAENTSPKPIRKNGYSKNATTIEDLMTDGVLDIKNTLDFVKKGLDEFKQTVNMFFGFGMMGNSYKSTLSSAIGSKSPMVTILKTVFNQFIMPETVKASLQGFQEALGGFTGMALDKAKNFKFANKFSGGFILDSLLDNFRPASGYKGKIDTSKYEHGRVDWDGESRQALTHVIPVQLSKILSALTGKAPELYDYKSGTWKTISTVKSDFQLSRSSYARYNSGDISRSYENTMDNLAKTGKISDSEARRLKNSGANITTELFHSDNDDYASMVKWDDATIKAKAKEYSISSGRKISASDLKTYISHFKHMNSRDKIIAGGEIATGRSSYGSNMRNLESSGGIEDVLFNNAFGGKKHKGVNLENNRLRAIFGADEYSKDAFFYIRNTYLATRHVSDNLEFLAGKSDTIVPISFNKTTGDLQYGNMVYKENTRESGKSNYTSAVNAKYNRKNSTALTEDAIANAMDNNDTESKKHQADVIRVLGSNNKELVDYYRIKMNAKITGKTYTTNPEYDDAIAKAEGTIDDLNKFKNSKLSGKFKGALTSKFTIPEKQANSLIEAVESSMSTLMYGTKEEPGLKDWLHDATYDMLNKTKIGQLIAKFIPKITSSFKELFSKKGGETAESEEGVPGFARGTRRITKTGLAVVSEGEMIVPSELNPYYHGKTDKNQQIRNEKNIENRYFGRFDKGTSSVGSKSEPISSTQSKGFLNGTKNFLSGGTVELISFFGSIYQSLFPNASKKQKKSGLNKEALNKDKAKISSLVSTSLKESGNNKGSMIAGAIIGGASSLLTGGLIGPIVGASTGAAIALTAKSNAVQDALFGKIEVNEKGENERSGGVLNKKVSNFITKYIPDMGKGAGIGGLTGLFMGSPVMGLILGSAVGFAKNNDNVMKTLFGSQILDKNGKDIGRNNDGLIKQSFIKKIKERSGGVAAGAIAGALAGPPLPGGIVTNIVLGSLAGFVIKSEKTQKMLFGDDKNKGAVANLGDLIKTKLIDPIVGIADKLSEDIKVKLRDGISNIGKSIREKAVNKIIGKIKPKFKNSAFGKIAGKAGYAMTAPLRGLANLPGKYNTRLEGKALRGGRNIMDRAKGRYLTASERITRANELGVDDGRFGEIDTLLANVNSSEELDALNTTVDMMIDPTKQFDKDIISSRNNSNDILKKYVNGQEGSKESIKTANNIRKAINGKNFVKAGKLVLESDMDSSLKSALYNNIKSMESANSKKRDTSSIAQARKALGNKLGVKNLNDNQLRAFKDRISAEKAGRFKEKSSEEKNDEAIAVTIPNYLETIIGLMAGGNKTAAAELSASNPTIKNVLANISKNNNTSSNKDGDTRTNPETNAPEIYNDKTGEWEIDTSTTNGREAEANAKNTRKNIGLIGAISTGIGGIGAILSKFSIKLFGSKKEKTQGLFGKLLSGLTGEDSILGKALNWITGGKGSVKNLSNIFSATSFATFLKSTVMPGLGLAAILALMSGVGNKTASALGIAGGTNANGKGGVGKNNMTTAANYTDAKGNTKTAYLGEDGKYHDATTGKIVSKSAIDSNSISSKISDKNTLSQGLWYNAARGALTGKKSLLSVATSKFIGKNATGVLSSVGKAFTSGGSAEATEALAKSASSQIMDACASIAKNLERVPVLNKLPIEDMFSDIGVNIGTSVEKNAVNFAKVASKALVITQIVFAVTDFTTGYEDAATTLKIKNPKTHQRILAGLLRVIKNCIPIIGSLIPESLIINIMIKHLAPALGIDTTQFLKDQAEAQAEVDNYNKANGTSYTWAQYNKSVRHDYTWTERIKNQASTTWQQTKSRAFNFGSSVKKNGLGGTLKNGIQSLNETMVSSYKSNGGGLYGTIEGVGAGLQKLLPGVLGEIPQVQAHILALASKGDIKDLWKVSLKDFTATGDEAAVQPFSKAIGQFPLFIAKLQGTMIGIIPAILNATGLGKTANSAKSGFGKAISKIMNFGKDCFSVIKELGSVVDQTANAFIKNKGPVELWKTKIKVHKDNPVSSIAGILVFSEKTLLTPLSITTYVVSKVAKIFIGLYASEFKALTSFVSENKVLSKAASNGVTTLWKTKINTPDSKIIGPLANIAVIAQKVMYTPISLMGTVGNAIYNSYKKFTKGWEENSQETTKAFNTMEKAASAGNVSEVWKTKINTKSKGILYGVEQGVNLIAKVYYTLSALLQKLSKPLKSLEDAVSTFGTNAVDNIKTGASVVAGGAKKAGTAVANVAKSGWNKAANFFNGVSGVEEVSGSGSFISQYDSKYSRMQIGNSNVAMNGCAPAAAYMAINANGRRNSFKDAVNVANAYQSGSGTDAAYFSNMAARNGMNANYYTNGNDIASSISSGRPTVLLGQDSSNRSKTNSPFGPNNHYVVANGIDRNGRLMINDPESNRGNKKYSTSILNHVKMGIGMSGGATLMNEQIAKAQQSKSSKIVTNPTASDYLHENLAVWSPLTETEINDYIANHAPANSPFRGQGKIFIEAAKKSKLDPRYILAHAATESAWGTSGICQVKNNYFGIGAFDSSPYSSAYSFNPGLASGIIEGAIWISKNYYYGKYHQTSVYMMKHVAAHQYATSNTWEGTIANIMSKLPRNTRLTLSESPNGSAPTATAILTGDVGNSSTGGSAADSDNSDSSGSTDLLSAVSSIFSKLSNIFTSATSTDAGTDSSSTSGSISTTDNTKSNPSVKGESWKGKTPVDYMKSIAGKIKYSMSGPRNPDKGSADCSSTVAWAIRKAGGPDIGNNSASQYNNKNLTQVWKGSKPTTIPNGLQPNDVLFFNRGTKGPDGVGHVGLYMGDGQYIDHGGSGAGPNIKTLSGTRLGTMIKASRITGESGSGSGLLNHMNSSEAALMRRASMYNPYSGGATGLSPLTASAISVNGNSSFSSSKVSGMNDSITILKYITTLIETLVSNTNSINNIYDVVSAILKGSGNAAAANAVQALKNNSGTSNEEIEKSMADLKSTVNCWFSDSSQAI